MTGNFISLSDPKVQFCSGGNKLPGFINTDLPDVDITKPLPYGDNTVSYIFIEHGLEHIGIADALKFLTECFRILKRHGTIRICVPELGRVTVEHGRDLVFGHGHQMIYDDRVLRHFLRLAGFDPQTIVETGRNDRIDSHWKVIGKEKDDIETLRMEAKK